MGYIPPDFAHSSLWCMSENKMQLFEQIRVQDPDQLSYDSLLWSGQKGMVPDYSLCKPKEADRKTLVSL